MPQIVEPDPWETRARRPERRDELVEADPDRSRVRPFALWSGADELVVAESDAEPEQELLLFAPVAAQCRDRERGQRDLARLLGLGRLQPDAAFDLLQAGGDPSYADIEIKARPFEGEHLAKARAG